jgi:hypothetical protein
MSPDAWCTQLWLALCSHPGSSHWADGYMGPASAVVCRVCAGEPDGHPLGEGQLPLSVAGMLRAPGAGV